MPKSDRIPVRNQLYSEILFFYSPCKSELAIAIFSACFYFVGTTLLVLVGGAQCPVLLAGVSYQSRIEIEETCGWPQNVKNIGTLYVCDQPAINITYRFCA